MHVVKMHGLGNDFIVLTDEDTPLPSSSDVVALCDRHRGVGADGVIRIARNGPAALQMEYRNADGSYAETCGNGLRCVAALAHHRGWVPARHVIHDGAGAHEVDVRHGEWPEWRVEVDMGAPSFEARTLPPGDGPRRVLPLANGDVEVAVVSLGNPHAIAAVGDVDAFPLADFARAIRATGAFPDGVNVEVVARVGAAVVARVDERGVGETAASGSGGCAARIGAVVLLDAPREGDVLLPGGSLFVRWDERVSQTGPAAAVFEADLASRRGAHVGAGGEGSSS